MDISTDLPRVYLKPGEYHFATSPTVVTTVLGSCVSVTMFDRTSGAASICHALLPEGPSVDAFRYVDSSILHMLRMFADHGVNRKSLVIKLFGGSDMLGAGGSRIGVGRRNVQIANQVIAASGLAVAMCDVGGTQGRKLIFVTHTGDVFLKRLNRGAGADWPGRDAL